MLSGWAALEASRFEDSILGAFELLQLELLVADKCMLRTRPADLDGDHRGRVVAPARRDLSTVEQLLQICDSAKRIAGSPWSAIGVVLSCVFTSPCVYLLPISRVANRRGNFKGL